MEEVNYNLLSNNELTQRHKNLEESFKKSQEALKEHYLLMTKYSEEAEMLENYLFKKQINLENSNLTDAKCYRLILSIRKKLSKK